MSKQYKFKQAVAIPGVQKPGELTKTEDHHFPLSIDGKPMVHEVPAEVEQHPHFQHYKKHGLIVDPKESSHLPQETLQERNERIAKSFETKPEALPVSDQQASQHSVAEEDAVAAFDGHEQAVDANGEPVGDKEEAKDGHKKHKSKR